MESCNTESSLDLPLESLYLQPFLQSLHKEQWQEVRLEEVAEMNQKNIDKSYPHKTIQYLDTGSIANNKIESLQLFDSAKLPSRAKRIVQNNDIIYSLVRPIQRHFGFIKNPPENLIVSTGFCVITTNNAILDSKFLYYYLTLNEIIELLDMIAEASTSAYPAIRPFDIENLTIPLPPLTTQQKIAEILSSFDDKIDLLHRQNKTLESLALTLFRHYFIDNPKRDEWEEKPLKYFGNIICGKTPPKNQKEYFNGTYPFIKIPDMHNNVFVFQTADSLTQQGLDSQKAKTLPPFSVCVSCIATIGVVSMNANIAQTNQQINSIVPYKECYRYFLYCSMKSSFDELEAMASGGTATANLNTTDFSNMKLLLPREKEILRFHTETLPFFDKIYNNTKQIQNLQAMRDLMLRKIFN